MKLPNPNTSDFLAVALQWVAEGWSVFPLRNKKPLAGSHGSKDASRDPEQVSRLFNQHPSANGVGGICDQWLVVDIDPRHGGETPEFLTPTRVHLSGGPDRGRHHVYRLPSELPRLKSSTGELAPGVDVKTGPGSYVVLPGSIHPDTGRAYRVDDNSPPVAEAPGDLIDRVRSSTSEKTERATLGVLLANPPTVGSRNVWLTRVCGHYAKMYRDAPDEYYRLVGTANRSLDRPLDADEVSKTAESILEAELERMRDPDLEDQLNEDNGWLVSGGDCIRTLRYAGPKSSRRPEPYELCRFDLRVVGKLWNPEEECWIYECDLVTRKDPTPARVFVNASEFGNPRFARQWLAKRALSVGSGADLVHTSHDWCSRLLTYLHAQEAPRRTITPHYGWDEDECAYLTDRYAIDARGARDFAQKVPHPNLVWSAGEYGFGSSQQEARELLAEVMHFQTPQVASLFGAWWAATLVKQWVTPQVSLFPVMALEAASGSGKTTGFFSLMVGMSGSSTGEGHYTPAVLRNHLASNRNGVTWVDDLENPESVHETIRVLTAGGSLSKMDANHNPQKFHLVGSLLLSGEALGFESQRALIDRVVLLSPPPPAGRVSHRDPNRSQWLDVVELQQRLEEIGGPQALAGHLLQECSGMRSQVFQWFKQEREQRSGSGRLRDRDLVLLVGARVLDHLVGGHQYADESGKSLGVYEWVSDWVRRKDQMDLAELVADADGGAALDADNTVTVTLLPRYLADHSGLRNPNVAAVVSPDESEVWLKPTRLANWWYELNRGRVNARTESYSAILAQLRQLRTVYPECVSSGVRKRLGGGRGSNPTPVWVLGGVVAETIRERLQYQ